MNSKVQQTQMITHRKVAYVVAAFIVAALLGYVPRYVGLLDNILEIIASDSGKAAGGLVMLLFAGFSGVFIIARPAAYNRDYSPRFSQTKEKLMTKGHWRIIGYAMIVMLFSIFELIID